MPRDLLNTDQIHAKALEQVGIPAHRATIDEVKACVAKHKVVLVGMSQNPYPKKARKLLEQQNIDFFELSYGSYFSAWRQRLALKMWSGWPTLPMIFVSGELVGGFSELEQLLASGELQQLLS